MWAFSQGRNVLVIFDRKRPSDVVREFFWGKDGRRFVGATDVLWVADFKNEGFNWSEPRLTIGQVTHLGARCISLEKAIE